MQSHRKCWDEDTHGMLTKSQEGKVCLEEQSVQEYEDLEKKIFDPTEPLDVTFLFDSL